MHQRIDAKKNLGMALGLVITALWRFSVSSATRADNCFVEFGGRKQAILAIGFGIAQCGEQRVGEGAVLPARILVRNLAAGR